jgi:AraC-like DNA-binding protein
MPDTVRPRQFGTRVAAFSTDEGVVRAAALLGVPTLLRESGLDPAKILSGLKIDPGTFNHPDGIISYLDAGRVLQRAAELTRCPHFGLLVGQRNDTASLGILGEIMLRSASVHAALRSLILHLHLQTRGGVPTHTVEDGNATLGYAIYQRGMPATTHVYDLVMAYEFNIMRALCGPNWRPIEVSFSHNKPKDLTPYRKFFAAPLRFGGERTAIIFSKSWLATVPPDSNPSVHRDLQRQIAVQELRQPDTHSEQIRRALRTMIVTGGATEAQISELLSIPGRTLRRLLLAEGTSFRSLLEEVHFEIARQLLADSEMATSEIAATLCYSDASAFTRAFRRWTDMPPAAWQAKFRSAEGGLRMAEQSWEE